MRGLKHTLHVLNVCFKVTTIVTVSAQEHLTTTTKIMQPEAAINGRQLEFNQSMECGQHGRKSGVNCICIDGYRGIQCQVPPIDLICEKNKISVTLSNSYSAYMETNYLPNGSFFICQTEQECAQKACPIERTYQHKWTECDSIVTRKSGTNIQ